ncbi:HK97-gp10 family putative phage morphogenesis protein [Bradyrhizobium monzae]|uniref:HK97-gp10 family putative phage morphogenesis protein n=1 Tax=Bradyrhizobium sp. Oc8 TaxID=2876780 RepID=UPI001F1F4628|nr:HK97-gp10 family putative phage morphogenesis protein [Bradyrhizobium sp. Oc8]
MADDLETYLTSLPDKLTEQLSDVLREQAFRLSDSQREALRALEQSPESGALEASCSVAPGANDLEYIVQAGGDMTTKEVREGSGEPYDYAEAFEYGTSHQTAQPFFWPTYRALKPEIQEAINDAVSEVLK